MDSVAKRERGCWPFTTTFKRFFWFVRHWKIPGTNGNCEKVVPFGTFRMEISWVSYILCSLDQNKSVILLSLNLSAALDTVDHATLIYRLSNRFGMKGTALAWFKSYLASRQQFVNVEEGMSSRRPLLRGVPQGVFTGLTAVPRLYCADCWYHQKAWLTIPSVRWWHATIYFLQYRLLCWLGKVACWALCWRNWPLDVQKPIET